MRYRPPPSKSEMQKLQLPDLTLDTFGEPELVDLEDRTAHILRMRSGMIDGEAHTLREVGEELGVSGARVGQLQRQGLTAIRFLRAAQRHQLVIPVVHRRYPWRVLQPRPLAESARQSAAEDAHEYRTSFAEELDTWIRSLEEDR
jgi:hypothetical protein